MSADGIRVNGVQYSWGSLVLKIGDETWSGPREISYSHKRSRVKTYGMGRHQGPRGRTRGKYEVDPVKLVMPTASAELLRKKLADLVDGTNYGDAEFDATLQYIENEGTDSEVPMTVEFQDLVWESTSVSLSEGNEETREEVQLDCMRIIENGRTMFDSRTG